MNGVNGSRTMKTPSATPLRPSTATPAVRDKIVMPVNNKLVGNCTNIYQGISTQGQQQRQAQSTINPIGQVQIASGHVDRIPCTFGVTCLRTVSLHCAFLYSSAPCSNSYLLNFCPLLIASSKPLILSLLMQVLPPHFTLLTSKPNSVRSPKSIPSFFACSNMASMSNWASDRFILTTKS